jgi:hypothetical protein
VYCVLGFCYGSDVKALIKPSAAAGASPAAKGPSKGPSIEEPEQLAHNIRLRDVLGSPVDSHATIDYDDEEGTLKLSGRLPSGN